jgi:hypothetical protein
MLDARPLKLISSFLVLGRHRAKSIFWHRVYSQACTCQVPHGNCHTFPCPCPSHRHDLH